jgi:DNA polymerase
MIVGEGPGAEEDKKARPFVGRAGKLLDKLLSAADIHRSNTWITNIVRCRPVTIADSKLQNRPPRVDEIKACEIWMEEEYKFVAPQAVVCLGTIPARALISRDFKIGERRGGWYVGRHGIPTIGTYHPAYVLRLQGSDRMSTEQEMIEDFLTAKSLLKT